MQDFRCPFSAASHIFSLDDDRFPVWPIFLKMKISSLHPILMFK